MLPEEHRVTAKGKINVQFQNYEVFCSKGHMKKERKEIGWHILVISVLGTWGRTVRSSRPSLVTCEFKASLVLPNNNNKLRRRPTEQF